VGFDLPPLRDGAAVKPKNLWAMIDTSGGMLSELGLVRKLLHRDDAVAPWLVGSGIEEMHHDGRVGLR